MSAALNAHPDLSIQSVGTPPDISLGSFLSTPLRRKPDETSSLSRRYFNTTVTTPGGGGGGAGGGAEGIGDDGLGDVLDTPGDEKKRWQPGDLDKIVKRSGPGKGGVTLTLRDQEKVRRSYFSPQNQKY